MDCIFCKISKRELASTIVHEDSDTLAFRDVNPQAPTHIIVIPKDHIEKMSDINEHNYYIAGKLVFIANRLADREQLKKGFRLVFNCGPDGGQTVNHLHLHLLGGRRMIWPPG